MDPVLAPGAQRHMRKRWRCSNTFHFTPKLQLHTSLWPHPGNAVFEGSGRGLWADNFSHVLRMIFTYFHFYLSGTLVPNLHGCNHFLPFIWEQGRRVSQASEWGLSVLSFLLEWSFAASSVRCSWTPCIFQALKDTVNYNVIEKWACFLEMKCNQ